MKHKFSLLQTFLKELENQTSKAVDFLLTIYSWAWRQDAFLHYSLSLLAMSSPKSLCSGEIDGVSINIKVGKVEEEKVHIAATG